MAKKHYEIIKVDGAKAVSLFGDEGWDILSGGTAEKTDNAFLSARVAVVFRGMQLRANAVASIPFDMVDLKGNIIDSTDDWQNQCGFLPSPELLFWLLEAAWTLYGKGYIYQSKNSYNFTKIFKALAPDSVTYDIENDVFKRNNKEFLPAKDLTGKINKGDSIVSLWMPDPDVEHGPPLKYPAKAALQAMGVLYNLDEASQGFFKRGMLHTYIFSVPPGTQQSDKDLLEDKVNSMLTGIKNAWRTLFVNADKITPLDIGGGLESLANVPLTKEKREDVSIALGIPMSKLFTESAAGLGGAGVVDSDDRKLIADTGLPEWKNITRQLNDQVFIPLGWRLVEKHEKLEVFREDEGLLGTNLKTYVDAYNANPKAFPVFAEILGVTLSDEQIAALASLEVKPEPVEPVVTSPVIQVEPIDAELDKEMKRYQRKALKHVGDAVSFESDIIPLHVLNGIHDALPNCKSEDEVRALFANPINQEDEVTRVVKALEISLQELEK